MLRVQAAHQGRLCGVEQEVLPPGLHEVLRLRRDLARILLHLQEPAHLREGLQGNRWLINY